MGVDVGEVLDWIDHGVLMAAPEGKGWAIDLRDFAMFEETSRLTENIVKAHAAHPDLRWRRGNCSGCGKLMNQPTRPHETWVCGAPCLARAPDGAEIVPHH